MPYRIPGVTLGPAGAVARAAPERTLPRLLPPTARRRNDLVAARRIGGRPPPAWTRLFRRIYAAETLIKAKTSPPIIPTVPFAGHFNMNGRVPNGPARPVGPLALRLTILSASEGASAADQMRQVFPGTSACPAKRSEMCGRECREASRFSRPQKRSAAISRRPGTMEVHCHRPHLRSS